MVWGEALSFPLYYLQAKGQAESSNKLVLTLLKKKLNSPKGELVKELPIVLCAIQTNLMGSIDKTSFSLVYQAKVVIVTEVTMLTCRANIENSNNNSNTSMDLVLIEEV